ncbi:hypothetical protein HVPorG_04751 (plasmid) [Roseomonas mucosa]|nr:hypothetical protein ADP8_04751 [Roseomonas mucosa]QDJ12146.1 hypothetical protein HVPorG_04751 [Roseomonas mucosa]
MREIRRGRRRPWRARQERRDVASRSRIGAAGRCRPALRVCDHGQATCITTAAFVR